MLNFRNLYYFWVVVGEGGFARAADRLGVAVQTISAQVRALEASLGEPLLRAAGRGVTMTAAGQAAFARADEMFRIGERIAEDVRAAAAGDAVRLAVGLTDGISKLAAHAVLAPALDTPSLRLRCEEGEIEALIADLALHRLDLVLASQPAAPHPALRLTSERLSGAAVDWYGPAKWATQAARERFPACLAELPILLPTAHSPLRAQLERSFDALGIRPRIVGEFEDSALMAVFAARGLGVFALSEAGAGDAALLRGLRRLGRAQGVTEEIYAIRSRRGEHHPLATRILAAAASG